MAARSVDELDNHISIMALVDQAKLGEWDNVYDGVTPGQQSLNLAEVALLCTVLVPSDRDAQEERRDAIPIIRRIIIRLLELFPEATRKELMLQSVLIWPELCQDKAFIMVFIEKFPGALLHGDENGDLPLHVACNHPIPDAFSCIALIPLISPEAAARRGSNGLFPVASPFRYSIYMGSDDHLAFSEHIFGTSESPSTPLPNNFIALAQAFPRGIFERGGFFDITMEHVDVYNLDYDVELPKNTSAEQYYIDSVFKQVYPKGLGLPDENEDLPLHVVCRCLTSVSFYEVFPGVLIQNKDAAKARNAEGKTPLLTYLQTMVQEISNAPNGRYRGWVMNKIRGLDLILNPLDELVKAHPEAVNIPDNTGVTSVHIVCDRNWPLEWGQTAQIVLDHINQDCARREYRDNSQLLLHRFLSDSRKREMGPGADNDQTNTKRVITPQEHIINKLITAYPAAVSIADPVTGRLPLVTACMNGGGTVSVQSLYEILRTDPIALSICREADQPLRKKLRLAS